MDRAMPSPGNVCKMFSSHEDIEKARLKYIAKPRSFILSNFSGFSVVLP